MTKVNQICAGGTVNGVRDHICPKLYKLRNILFFHKRINKLFSEENKVPRTLCEARKVAGSAKYKQSKTV